MRRIEEEEGDEDEDEEGKDGEEEEPFLGRTEIRNVHRKRRKWRPVRGDLVACSRFRMTIKMPLRKLSRLLLERPHQCNRTRRIMYKGMDWTMDPMSPKALASWIFDPSSVWKMPST